LLTSAVQLAVPPRLAMASTTSTANASVNGAKAARLMLDAPIANTAVNRAHMISHAAKAWSKPRGPAAPMIGMAKNFSIRAVENRNPA
jgi:hypothetical protein